MQFSDILVKNALFCDETEDYRTPAEPEAGDSVVIRFRTLANNIEVKRIIDEAYAQAKTIITEHMDVLHRCAQVLIEREKIGNAEFEAIFDGRELPEPGAEQTSLMSGMPSEGR